MTQVISQHGHDDMIHDAVLDYYGRRLATCSSDKTIKIFEIEGDNHKIIDSLRGHEGAVWSISWAHPKYGPILASSSYDGKVIIWRETTPSGSSPHTYTRLIDFALHSASVNLICWSPHELGALLACASSDGCVSVLSFNDSAANASGQGAWDTTVFATHEIGCNAVSWGPSMLPGSLEKAQTPGQGQQEAVRRLATAGSDCLVKLWEFNAAAGGYNQLCTLQGHTDWVRDVAWSPSLLGKSYIASASQDKTVRIWTLAAGLEPGDAGNWQCQVLSFECVIWRVSWSLSGNVLAVSGGDNRVGLWKERVRDGGWECVKTLED